VIRPRVVSDSVVYEVIRIARPFSSKLPYGPVLSMLRVEKLDEAIERVAIGTLRVRL
jgi:acyl-CoA reductase-like NAD-dependent aldehyde dehydrogenase